MTKRKTIVLTEAEYGDLLDAFAECLNQADEDCPAENRSRHFRTAIRDGKELHENHVQRYHKRFRGGK